MEGVAVSEVYIFFLLYNVRSAVHIKPYRPLQLREYVIHVLSLSAATEFEYKNIIKYLFGS